MYVAVDSGGKPRWRLGLLEACAMVDLVGCMKDLGGAWLKQQQQRRPS
jgi:hypothetical protein